MAKFNKALFIFRRDIRIHDNTALISALENSSKVIPLFIFDSRQKNHDYFSSNAFEFMVNSLIELKKSLEKKGSDLLVLEGDVLEILKDLKESEDFDALFFNKDYTPFSISRDKKIEEFCLNNDVSFNSFHDALINPPCSVLNGEGEMYKVFTAFYKSALRLDVSYPKSNKYSNYFCPEIVQKDLSSFIPSSNPNLFVKGGRREALSLLDELKSKPDYSSSRDFVFIDATSKLSAHLKFGTISIREAYFFVNDNFFFAHPLITQFYWRDFFYHVAFFHPRVFGSSFKEKYDNIKWWGSHDDFKAWQQGRTGFPLVDAAMRQLNETGWMHGRARMLVASFLVKNLGVDWRLGEKYFAQRLVDYDPCVNNGNWQWSASTGCDAQPYFRIFNPLTQQKKFDSDCAYIKKWVFELRDVSSKDIHSLSLSGVSSYPKSIIDYKESVSRAKYEFSRF